MAVRISRPRLVRPSGEYLVEKKGTPIIISFEDRKRKAGGNDIPALKEMFKRLGFNEPKVLSIKSSNKTDEARKREFLTQISDIASDINGLINTDVFFCVVLAFGGAGYVYLDSIDEVKVPLDDIISIFKGDRCPALLCKPKVFIVQTCDYHLRKIDPSEQQDTQGAVVPSRIPVEADLLVYQSEISCKYLEEKEKDSVKFGDKANLDVNPRELKMSPMVFCITESVKEMEGQTIDINQLLIMTNQKLKYYIDGEYWKRDDCNVWSTQEWKGKISHINSHPRLPITNIQLARKLIIPCHQ